MNEKRHRYRDDEKYATYKRRKKTSYRRNSGSGMGYNNWDDEDALLTVLRTMSDREVALLTGHSIEAVQAKRRRLRKGIERIAGYNPELDENNPYRLKKIFD